MPLTESLIHHEIWKTTEWNLEYTFLLGLRCSLRKGFEKFGQFDYINKNEPPAAPNCMKLGMEVIIPVEKVRSTVLESKTSPQDCMKWNKSNYGGNMALSLTVAMIYFSVDVQPLIHTKELYNLRFQLNLQRDFDFRILWWKL